MRTIRNLCVLGAMLALAACASAPKSPVPQPASSSAAPVLDASYDWHRLLQLPFGSLLKDAPFPLHEVLMFRDAAQTAQGDDAECYASERTAPRFLKQTPSEYLLCYKHDHLARVQATVNLPPQEAAQTFGDACELWQRNSGAAQTPAFSGAAASGEEAGGQAAANAARTSATAPGSNACEGREGSVGYSSRLEENADRIDTAISIHLESLAQP